MGVKTTWGQIEGALYDGGADAGTTLITSKLHVFEIKDNGMKIVEEISVGYSPETTAQDPATLRMARLIIAEGILSPLGSNRIDTIHIDPNFQSYAPDSFLESLGLKRVLWTMPVYGAGEHRFKFGVNSKIRTQGNHALTAICTSMYRSGDGAGSASITRCSFNLHGRIEPVK